MGETPVAEAAMGRSTFCNLLTALHKQALPIKDLCTV